MNPFEIRLELLKLAYQIEIEKIASDRNRQEQDWYVNKDLAMVAIQQQIDGPSILPFPTTKTINVEDVISAAETLNAFVSKSNDSK